MGLPPSRRRDAETRPFPAARTPWVSLHTEDRLDPVRGAPRSLPAPPPPRARAGGEQAEAQPGTSHGPAPGPGRRGGRPGSVRRPGSHGRPLPSQVNALTSFVIPMAIVSVLNSVIANKLTVMVRQAAEPGPACRAGDPHRSFSMAIEPGRVQALRHGVRVLRT